MTSRGRTGNASRKYWSIVQLDNPRHPTQEGLVRRGNQRRVDDGVPRGSAQALVRAVRKLGLRVGAFLVGQWGDDGDCVIAACGIDGFAGNVGLDEDVDRAATGQTHAPRLLVGDAVANDPRLA